MTAFLIPLLQLISQILTLLIVAHALLSFVLAPYHPIRETVDRLVDPMLRPIRQFMPSTGGLDFSPLVLIILIQVITSVLISLLRSI